MFDRIFRKNIRLLHDFVIGKNRKQKNILDNNCLITRIVRCGINIRMDTEEKPMMKEKNLTKVFYLLLFRLFAARVEQ